MASLRSEELRDISDDLGARGAFRRIAEVVGAAAPGPQGLLTAEMSGTESVWHAQRVQRHYEDTETDSDGDRRTVRRTETVAENFSTPTFTVVRDGHTIVVDPGGRRLDGPSRSSTGSSRPRGSAAGAGCRPSATSSTATTPSASSTPSGWCAPVRPSTCSAR